MLSTKVDRSFTNQMHLYNRYTKVFEHDFNEIFLFNLISIFVIFGLYVSAFVRKQLSLVYKDLLFKIENYMTNML